MSLRIRFNEHPEPNIRGTFVQGKMFILAHFASSLPRDTTYELIRFIQKNLLLDVQVFNTGNNYKDYI